MTAFKITRADIESASYRQLQKYASQASKAFDAPYPANKKKDSLLRFLAQFTLGDSREIELKPTVQYDASAGPVPAPELACALSCLLTCELPVAEAVADPSVAIAQTVSDVAAPQVKISSVVLFAASFVMSVIKSIPTTISFEVSPLVRMINERYGYAAFLVYGLALMFAFAEWVWRYRSEILAPVVSTMAIWMLFVR